ADEVRDFFWRRPDYPLGFYMSARLGRHTDVFALANERLDNDLLLEMRPFWNPTLGLPEQEEFIPLMERVGLIEYWDATEWPAFCRRENETISCDMSRVTPELVAPIRDVTM
ncbi:MAG: hypothetical protein QNJ11_18425, partial [Woeseiaceae bacterium]|nr:hypothetical protein [Woeseiaceae bacterium]